MGKNRTKADKEAAFAALFKDLYPVLYVRVLGWCGRPQLASDVVQDVFVALWESRRDFRQLTNPEAYLMTASRNQLVRLLRKEGRALPKDFLPLSGSEYAEFLIAGAAAERMEEVRKALDALSPTERDMLAAKFFEGKSYDELAQATGKEKRTIYNQVFRAVEKLRKVLGVFF